MRTTYVVLGNQLRILPRYATSPVIAADKALLIDRHHLTACAQHGRQPGTMDWTAPTVEKVQQGYFFAIEIHYSHVDVLDPTRHSSMGGLPAVYFSSIAFVQHNSSILVRS